MRQWNKSVITNGDYATCCHAIVPTDRFTGFSLELTFLFIFALVKSLPVFLCKYFDYYCSWLFLVLRKLVLVITYFRGGFGKNCPSAFLKILQLPEYNEGNLKTFKNHESDLFQKLPESNMWLLINHTKPTNTSYWN